MTARTHGLASPPVAVTEGPVKSQRGRSHDAQQNWPRPGPSGGGRITSAGCIRHRRSRDRSARGGMRRLAPGRVGRGLRAADHAKAGRLRTVHAQPRNSGLLFLPGQPQLPRCNVRARHSGERRSQVAAIPGGREDLSAYSRASVGPSARGDRRAASPPREGRRLHACTRVSGLSGSKLAKRRDYCAVAAVQRRHKLAAVSGCDEEMPPGRPWRSERRMRGASEPPGSTIRTELPLDRVAAGSGLCSPPRP
jgi:hypothetical protein